MLEVRPDGTVVWEVYAPWLVYEAERVRPGDGSQGPTIADMNATGSYSISGDTNRSASDIETCDRALSTFEPGRWEAVETSTRASARTSARTPTRTPIADDGPSEGPAGLFGIGTVAGVLALICGTALIRYGTRWGTERFD